MKLLFATLLLSGIAQAQIFNPWMRIAPDTTPPTILTAVGNTSSLVVTFSEPPIFTDYTAGNLDLDIVSGLQNIAATHTGTVGNVATFTLASPLTNGATVNLDLAPSAIKDAAGNYTAAVTDGAVTNSTPANPGTIGLMAWWKLDDTPPTTWDDAHSTFNLTEGVTPLSIAGVNGTALDLNDGDSDNLFSSAISNTFHQSNFTVACHVNMDEASNSQGFMSQYDSTSTGGRRHWMIDHLANGKFRFVMYNSAGTEFVASSNNNYTSNAAWYHVVGVRSGNTLTLYVDGVAQTATATFSGTEHTAAQNFRLGVYLSTYYNGAIDDAVIYSKALTPGEIQFLYENSYDDL